MSCSVRQTGLRALLPESNRIYEQILKDVTVFEEDLRTLELARKLVPFIIASGVFVDRDTAAWRELISPLADIAGEETKAEQHKERIIAALERLLPTSEEVFDLTEEISGLPYEYWRVRDRAAYMLGVAVGHSNWDPTRSRKVVRDESIRCGV